MNNPKEALHNPQNGGAEEARIYGMGIRSQHPPEHVARTPVFDGYLVMCFRNRFCCTTDAGTEEGEAGGCVIHPPHYPQIHGTPAGSSEGFSNDWISVQWSGISALLAEYSLPLNTIIQTGAPSLIEPFLTKIHIEVYDNALFAARAVAVQLELLFLEIARTSARETSPKSMTRTDVEIRNRLLDVRVQVHQRLGKRWTVAAMADLANLSPGYFSTRYTEFFGVSPIDDLVERRTQLAKRLLLQPDYEIAAIAERCGFSDVYYFSRIFKQRVGSPPGGYRVRCWGT
jgi:AraC-like DNA-binding protein